MTANRAKLLGILAFEVALFGLASVAHRGLLVPGYEHAKASVAEMVIAIVLGAGLVVSLVRPAVTHTAAAAVQWFALLGTLTGVVMILIGVGPRTVPDFILHGLMLATLAIGIRIAAGSADFVTGSNN